MRILDVYLMGGFASRMIEYLVARHIAAQAGDCLISNVILPEWSIHHPILPGASQSETGIPTTRNDFDMAEIVNRIRTGESTRVTFKSYATWLANFPTLDFCRNLFPASPKEHPGFGSEFLVCSVRGAEILDGSYRDHVLLPIEFYADLARETGLQLVFLGQIADNAYCRALRRRFPGAIFQPSRGPLVDFQTLRNSTNIVPAVSTFSWLAAWFSSADTIVLPISGIFHPEQCPGIDLLPYEDARYRFFLFPKHYAVPVERVEEEHGKLNWRPIQPEKIPALRATVYRRPQELLDQFLSMFDEEFYLATYPDVARELRARKLPSGRAHYITHGFAEGRRGFRFDERWYGKIYPAAIRAVELGEFKDLLHHFVAVGAEQGYKPFPAH